MPAFHFSFNDIFYGCIFGFILALPLALFVSYWFSAVKNHLAVVFGAFLGALIGVLIIYFWTAQPFSPQPLAYVNGVATFFGTLFFCAIAGVVGGMLMDLFVARGRSRDYRRAAVHE